MTGAVAPSSPRIQRRDPAVESGEVARSNAPSGRSAAVARGPASLVDTPASPRVLPTRDTAAAARLRMTNDPMANAWRARLLAPVPGGATPRDLPAGTTPRDLAPATAADQAPGGLPNLDLARGDTGPDVQAVQQALVDRGYLTAQQMATGPGIFGPQTQAALQKYQRENDVPVTGKYDPATRASLGASMPDPTSGAGNTGGTPTAPGTDLARGASGPEVSQLQDSLVSLGYLKPEDKATGPGEYGPRTESAVRRFQVDHGLPPSGQYDGATRDWMTRRIAGEPAPPPPPPGTLPGSAADANQYFVTQFTSGYNPTGPSSSANCGPASVAMALDAAGKMPDGLDPEQRIDYARSLMNPGVTPTSYVDVNGQRIPQLDADHDYSGTGQIKTAFNQAGGNGYSGSGWDELDAALKAGHPVVADGYYGKGGWGATLESAGKDLGYTDARAGGGNVGHFNAILGMTADGKYVVADPMYTGGTVEMTREQLGQFFSPTNGVPSFSVLG